MNKSITSCGETKSPEQTLFPERVEVTSKKTNIDKENLSQIEALNVLGYVLIVYDEFLGQKCTLLNLEDSTNWLRFGTIGQGPNELNNGCFIISYDCELKILDLSCGAIYNYDHENTCTICIYNL